MGEKHSPGPWRWTMERFDGGSDTRPVLVDAHGASVMLAYNPADARLVAAAPEMLELLRQRDSARVYPFEHMQQSGMDDCLCWWHACAALVNRIDGAP